MKQNFVKSNLKTEVHLVSMPWMTPSSPSIQLGVLKAYLDTLNLPELKVKTYHAHFLIPFLSHKNSYFSFYEHCEARQEYVYSLLFLREFGAKNLVKNVKIRPLLDAVNKSRISGMAQKKMTEKDLDRLKKGTEKFVDDYLAPQLSRDGINLIGFTLNHHQVIASAYVMTYLNLKYSSYRFKFLCGGTSAGVPSVVDLFRQLELPVIVVLGEGEKKLEAICRSVGALSSDCDDKIIEQSILSSEQGIFHAFDTKNHWVRNVEDYKTQIKDLSTLPIPDYKEYFSMLKACSDNDETHLALKEQVVLLAEGSRGCFAKCAFCGLNNLWEGFRRIKPDHVLKKLYEMIEAYELNRVCFVDNVCDAWAEGYADHLIESKLNIPAFMEMRAHHPEIFWTKLALSGVDSIQVGVEALAPGILKAIKKGTRVFQNLAAQKYLTELNVSSISNLISFHPGTTVEDILETKRVLELTPHMQPLILSKFLLAMGSPLYESIPVEQRPKLDQVRSVKFPKKLSVFAQEYWHLPPTDWVPDEVKQEWRKFFLWHKKFEQQNKELKPSLTVARRPHGCLMVVDTRFGTHKEFLLDKKSSLVLEVCHSSTKPELLEKYTGLPDVEVQEILASLIKKKLIICVDEHCLSLPLRPKQELIMNYYEAAAKSRRLRVADDVQTEEQTDIFPNSEVS